MLKIGFLGPPGTYTEEAAKAAVANATYLPYPSIEAVFEAVLQHEVDRGLVPIENVIQGPVTETLDNLYSERCGRLLLAAAADHRHGG